MNLYRAYSFTWTLMLNWDSKSWTSLWALMTIMPDLKSLVRVSLLLLSPSLGGLVLPTMFDEAPVRFLWSYGL